MWLEILESPTPNGELLLVAEERLKQLHVECVEGEGGVGVLWAVGVFGVELRFGENVVREELCGGMLSEGGWFDTVHGLGVGIVVVMVVVGHGVVGLGVGHGRAARARSTKQEARAGARATANVNVA